MVSPVTRIGSTDDATTVDDIPSSWSCDSDNKRVKVEVLVAGTQNNARWLEIPTTDVELTVNENGVADINRYARVDFPTEWENKSVVNLIEGYDPTDNQFSYVRIFIKKANDDYVLQHFGFAGGVGPTGTEGVSKMWVYDLNELIKAVPANFTYNKPTPMKVLEDVTQQLDNLTGVMREPLIIKPDTLDEVTEFVLSGVPDEQRDLVVDILLEGDFAYSIFEDGKLNRDDVPEFQENFDTFVVDTTGVTTDINLRELQFDVKINQKVFRPNRDTLIDVLDWLAEKLNAKWHIEPFLNGGRIVLDIFPEGRNFVQDVVVGDFLRGKYDEGGELAGALSEERSGDFLPVHNAVRLENNTALADILPTTSVVVRGETSTSLGERIVATSGNATRNMTGISIIDIIEERLIPEYNVAPDPLQPSKKYPEVKARIEPFYQRVKSLGNENAPELTATVIESDDRTLGAAKRTARKELLRRVKDAGTGDISMFGSPNIMPYDKVIAYPTCSGFVPNTTTPPIRYRVNSVTHDLTGGEEYRTTVDVSIYVGKNEITADGEMRVVEEADLNPFDDLGPEEDTEEKKGFDPFRFFIPDNDGD